MKDKKINRPVVLVAPMDWGLGHATRCIPIITTLLEFGCEVLVAADGAPKTLLQKEFRDIRFLELGGYQISYGGSGFSTRMHLIRQIPKIFRTIRRENRWLKNTIQKEGVDLLISDNRMGLYSRDIPCIYITHQLQVQTGNRITDILAQKIHYWFINRFSECWVPDLESGQTLAGALSHPPHLPKTTLKYLGPLSRFSKKEAIKKYDVAILLSGPEPQRTMLEKIVCKEAGLVSGKKIMLIRGLPDETRPLQGLPEFVEQMNHADGETLNSIILQSECVFGRCGYSTVMDLAVLGKNALLIPTPGQTEQEYLANFLSASHLFCCIAQEDFTLMACLESVTRFPFRSFSYTQVDYRRLIAERVKQQIGDQQ